MNPLQPISPPVIVPIAAWTLVCVIFLVGVADVYLAHMPGQVTISAYLSDLASRYPLVPLLLGVVLGHLFWSGTR